MTSAKQGLLKGVATAIVAGLIAGGPQMVLAQSRPAAPADETTGLNRRINLGVGRSVIVDLPRDAAEIFVSDPKVANAVVRSSRKLYLVATGAGQTSIYAMDAQGNRIATIEVTIGRDVAELDRILKTAMPTANVVSRTINNTIILTGAVDSAGEAQMAFDIAKGFVSDLSTAGGGAGKVINSLVIRGRDQVMLKVTIAEVQRNVMKQLGVTNAALNGNWGRVDLQNSFVNALSNSKATLGNAAIAGLSAEIKAYEKTGVAKILAEPSVTAVSGESAKFTAGGEVPVASSLSCDPINPRLCTTGISFKPYGVTLNFTPVVLSEGRILLRVATEVTELDPTTSVALGGGVSAQAFRTRKNETSVELPSGGSIVSAGLVQSISRQTINGLPGLMNLPVLGALFRSRDYERHETELIIVITPYIAKTIKPSEVALPTDGFSDSTDPQASLLGRVNRIYSTAENPQLMKNYRGHLGFIAD